MHLRHKPVARVRHRPKHNLLWMHWGNERSSVPEAETIFHFSNVGTAAAGALREKLAERNVSSEPWSITWPAH